MELFRNRASMPTAIQDGIQVAGSFEGFTVGPLASTGITTPTAKVQFELIPSKQHFLLEQKIFNYLIP
jgi:hypothetical protein